jgi:hypothetical protein
MSILTIIGLTTIVSCVVIIEEGGRIPLSRRTNLIYNEKNAALRLVPYIIWELDYLFINSCCGL